MWAGYSVQNSSSRTGLDDDRGFFSASVGMIVGGLLLVGLAFVSGWIMRCNPSESNDVEMTSIFERVLKVLMVWKNC